eukprot:12744175-Ditylum_brightwellii.AAC.1
MRQQASLVPPHLVPTALAPAPLPYPHRPMWWIGRQTPSPTSPSPFPGTGQTGNKDHYSDVKSLGHSAAMMQHQPLGGPSPPSLPLSCRQIGMATLSSLEDTV